jgi:DNA repair protein RadC
MSRVRVESSTMSSIADSGSGTPRPRGNATKQAIDMMSDAELLALVLGTPSPRLLENGVAGLARAGVGELAELRGMGPVRAARVGASIELGRRALLAASLEPSVRLPDKDAVVAWARPRLAMLDHEELWVLALDGRSGMRAARLVASGGLHGLQIGVRDVLRIALKEAASSFIIVHNHPSGSPAPSDEDIAFTRKVMEGAAAVGTPLVDHVIIARQHSSSMLDLGLLGV